MPEAVVAGLGEVRETVRVLADLNPMQDVTISRTDTSETYGLGKLGVLIRDGAPGATDHDDPHDVS